MAVARVAWGEESTFALDLDIPWAWAENGDAIIGNPTIGLFGGGKFADFMGMYGGLWIGIPTQPSVEDQAGLNTATQKLAVSRNRRFVDAPA